METNLKNEIQRHLHVESFSILSIKKTP